MATVRLSTRLIAAGGCVAAIAAVPLVAVFAGSAPARTLADCPGEVNMNLLQEGAPVQSNCPAQAPGPPAGAPSQDLLTRCSGIPGCLSNNLYGPGNVQVPNRSPKVHQSQ
ncbi:hypothetical protein [Mycobacterium sp.]|jgi:hypothetical protein|uniref:hypothetical protein n=1 Tax=Mycobacterium sp. TaxID=1785 RepID=UPI002D3FE32F|nr:hypothetical protein [Mycobacterium sp.]HZA10110.1 hypothetical protein [Mycobacterium sp.]